jgi:hypothetical protein
VLGIEKRRVISHLNTSVSLDLVDGEDAFVEVHV